MHENQNDPEGVFDIGGLEFDQDFWYLPNYRYQSLNTTNILILYLNFVTCTEKLMFNWT